MPSKLFIIGPTESVLTKRGNRFPDLAQYLFEEGYDLEYITSNFYHAEKRFFSRCEIEKTKERINYGFSVIPVLGYKENISVRRVCNNFLFSFFVFFKLVSRARKGDVVVIPSRPVELIFFVAIVLRLRGVQGLLDVQDVWPDALSIKSFLKQKLFAAYCNLWLRPSVKWFDDVILVTPGFNKWVGRYAPGKSTKVIPLGWESSRWPSPKNEVEQKELLCIGCVAQLQHQIDIIPILEVLRKRPELHLIVVGEDGHGERYDEVRQYINEFKLTNVSFAGVVPREAVPDILSACDVGILPMITSSLPNKIFDYLGACLPIIVLGENDSSRFVGQYEVGWFCGYSGKELERLISSIDPADLMRKRNRVSDVRDAFSREKLHAEFSRLVKI